MPQCELNNLFLFTSIQSSLNSKPHVAATSVRFKVVTLLLLVQCVLLLLGYEGVGLYRFCDVLFCVPSLRKKKAVCFTLIELFIYFGVFVCMFYLLPLMSCLDLWSVLFP